MTPSQLIAFLNAMSVGDLVSLRAKLEEARQACLALGLPDLADRLAEAGSALAAADLKTYRRAVETVVSRLGHVRARADRGDAL